MDFEDPERGFNRLTLPQIEDSTLLPLRAVHEPNKDLPRAPGVDDTGTSIDNDAHAAGISLSRVAGEAVLVVVPEKLMVRLKCRKQIFRCLKKGAVRFDRPSLSVHSVCDREIVPYSKRALKNSAGRQQRTAEAF